MARDEDTNERAPKAAEACQITEAEIDQTLEDSFPASDPPSWTRGSDHCVTPEEES